MRALPVLTCLWPGLSRLWLRGAWGSLAAAAAFGAALQLVLVFSFVWPGTCSWPLLMLGWITLAAVWFGSAVRSYRSLPDLRDVLRVDDRGLFIRAQGEYLKGHWFEAETLLQQLIRSSPRDVSTHLMLAALYRHTRRVEEARQRLLLIDRLDGSERWQWEIACERRWLQRTADSMRETDLQSA